MSFDLWENDFIGDIPLAHLTDEVDYQDLRESQDCLISVQYNEIDLGQTDYGFNQEFKEGEANLYYSINFNKEAELCSYLDNLINELKLLKENQNNR